MVILHTFTWINEKKLRQNEKKFCQNEKKLYLCIRKQKEKETQNKTKKHNIMKHEVIISCNGAALKTTSDRTFEYLDFPSLGALVEYVTKNNIDVTISNVIIQD